MKKRRGTLPALCCTALLFTGCASQLPQPEADQIPSAQPSPTASPEPTPEPLPDTDDLDVLARSAEEGEILPDSLLLAPVELSKVLEGNLIGYSRLRTDGWVFEWLESDDYKEDEFWTYQEEKLVISGGSAGQAYQVLEVWNYTPSNWDVDANSKLIYRDVDFDSRPDILVCTGLHGNQGYLAYDCFLQRKDGFEECVSFSNIKNPAIDEENQLILSNWRENAATHSWGMYAYQDGEFVLTRVLTEEPAPDGILENEIIWQWTENGEVICCSDENTSEEINNLIFNENSEWGVSTDRWLALYNDGLMADISIYHEE